MVQIRSLPFASRLPEERSGEAELDFHFLKIRSCKKLAIRAVFDLFAASDVKLRSAESSAASHFIESWPHVTELPTDLSFHYTSNAQQKRSCSQREQKCIGRESNPGLAELSEILKTSHGNGQFYH